MAALAPLPLTLGGLPPLGGRPATLAVTPGGCGLGERGGRDPPLPPGDEVGRMPPERGACPPELPPEGRGGRVPPDPAGVPPDGGGCPPGLLGLVP